MLPAMIDRIGNRRAMRFYLKEWRDKFGLSQDQLADRMNTSKSKISKLERGSQAWGPKWVAAAAEAFNLDDEQALFRHPDAPSPDELLAGSTPEQRAMAINVIQALLKTGS